VVAFRDWLTAHPAERQRYEELKRALAAQYAGDADYDDYTRGKTPYLDEVQPVVEEWSTTREQRR
jgi:dephospho-CoA kinase